MVAADGGRAAPAAGGGAGSAAMATGGHAGGVAQVAAGHAAGGEAGSLASAGAGGSGDACRTNYTTASHIVMNVSWASSIAVSAGTGKVHMWSRSKFVDNGDSAAIETTSCGSLLPVISTTAIAGNAKILAEIPDATWDNPAMPKFVGSATRAAGILTVDSGVALLGLSMTDPSAAWPTAAADITPVDHDGDSFPGVTAIPKSTSGFSAPPTSLSQSAHADKLYLAIRTAMTLSVPISGCPSSYSGAAHVSHFENHVVGCHVKGGSACSSSERDFIDQNNTQLKAGSATFDSLVVADDASCADVRAALPME
jgi:hypothetical protein